MVFILFWEILFSYFLVEGFSLNFIDLGFGFTFRLKVLLTFESCSISICASFFLLEFEGLKLI